MKRNIGKKMLGKAKKIKLIATDVDGVLTAGEFILLNSGEEIKIWNIRDRFAYTLLRKSGLDIKLAWITARKSEQVRIRAEELKIEFLYQNYREKIKALNEMVEHTCYKYDNIAYIGDDWLDIPILKRVGLSICPKDAPDEVRKIVDYTSRYDGGKGVFRELVEIVMKAQNAYKKVIQEYEI